MTPRYPGAFWRPTGDNGAMARPLDSFTWHEVVSRAEQSIFSYVQQEKVCQAYNGRWGYFEQYMDWDRLAWGVADGNSHRATIESFDGLLISNANGRYTETGMGGEYGTDANSGRWDAGQCERWADLAAWAYLTLGIPLRVMASSRTEETGHAPHRLGIAPWRVAGGEVWTKHDGKPCPGDLRVAQMPAIIERAKVIAAAVQAGRCSWLPPGVVDMPAALARTESAPKPPPSPQPNPEPEYDVISPEDRTAIANETVALLLDTVVTGKDSTGEPVSSSLRKSIVLNTSLHRGMSRIGLRTKNLAQKAGLGRK